MKKRIVGIMMMFVMTATLFAGCGKGSASGTEQSTEGAHEVVNGGMELDSGDVELKIWCAEEEISLMTSVCQNFASKHQGEANFSFVIEPMPEGEAIKSLLNDIENAPDVFCFVDDPGKLVAGGAISPVQNADEVASANSAGAVSTATINDVLYAYPMTADNGYFLYYDKSVFSEEDVASWDSLLAAASASGKKVTFDFTSGWYLYGFFGQTDLKVGLNDDGISNHCNWNDTTTSIKGIDVTNAILNISGNPAFYNTNDDGLKEGAANGTVAAGVSGVWLASSLEEAWGENLAATKLPTYTCNGTQIQMGSFAGYKMCGVSAYSEHVGWSHELANWITNEENQLLRFKERGLGPANINASNSPEVQASVPLQGLMAQSPYTELQKIGGAYWEPVGTYGGMLASGDFGGKDIQKVLDEMVEEITSSNSK